MFLLEQAWDRNDPRAIEGYNTRVREALTHAASNGKGAGVRAMGEYMWMMHRIHYAGDSFLTGSDIARALLEYAQVLASVGQAATVEIPTLSDDGTPGRSIILIGPSSQVIAGTEDSAHPEILDPDLVASMASSVEMLQHPGGSTPVVTARTRDSNRDWQNDDWDGLDVI